jgi:hypothetical protein
MDFPAAIAIFALLAALYVIPRVMVRRAELECISLLRVWLEENGMSLLRYRLIWVVHDGDSPPRAIYFVDVEDLGGRKQAGCATIIGKNDALRDFIPVSVDFRSIRRPQFRLRTLMGLVVYAAIDLAALRAALTRGSLLCLLIFGVLTFLVPPVAYILWRLATSRAEHAEGRPFGHRSIKDNR